jgi:hypothetical protein
MPESATENDITTGDKAQAEASEVTIKTTDAQTPAESSTAEVKDDKGDMLAAVKAALEPKTEKPSDSDEPGSKPGEADAKPDADKEGAEAEAEPDTLTEEETAQLRPKTRKRIENLVRDRRERDDKIATLEPKAQQFDQIRSFVDEAGLNKDEVNEGFAVMRDLKREPFKAYQRLKPIMAQLASMFGDGDLPDDLRQDVATGQITEQRARELVAARSHSSIATTQATENAKRDQERREVEARQQNVSDVAGAVTEWENSKAKTDPDWKVKQPRVMDLVELEIARRQRTEPTYFPTKNEALKLTQDALAKVEKDLKAYAPRPRAINPVTDAGSTRSVAKPTNPVEAAKLALSQMG